MPVPEFGNINNASAADFTSAYQSFRSETQQENTPLSLFNADSADIKLARQLAEEQINVTGAQVLVYPRTDNGDNDSVWDEDADPTYLRPQGFKAFFKPEPIQSELTKWGVDTKIQTDVNFTFQQLYSVFGERMLRPGDVIQLPYGSAPINPVNFRVLNATPSGNYRYVWIYFQCKVEQLTADVTVRVTDDMPQEEHIRTGGVYRESL
jgi:hypothetical protein